MLGTDRHRNQLGGGRPQYVDPLHGDDGALELPGGAAGVVVEEEGEEAGTAGLLAGVGGVERSPHTGRVILLRSHQ